MIKEVRCDKCNKKLAEELEGTLKIICSRCKYCNSIRSFNYQSHRLVMLEKQGVV